MALIAATVAVSPNVIAAPPTFLQGAVAVQADGMPKGGTPLLGPDPIAALKLQGDATKGNVSHVDVKGPGFTNAVRAETTSRPDNDWQFEVGSFTMGDVKVGDVVLATFYARALKGQVENGQARAVFDFQTGPPNWSKSVSQPLGITREWKRFYVPLEIKYDSPAGQGSVAIRLGYNPQIVEFAALDIRNYGKTLKLRDLPRTPTTYEGQEESAAWRKTALARIQKIRMAPLTVKVVDSKGKVVPNAKIQIAMTRHAFGFGTAVAADQLIGPGKDSDIYRAKTLEMFNQVAIENHLKWPFFETWGRADGLKAVDWANQHNLKVRAHNVIWPGYGNLPDDVRDIKDKVALEKRIDDHIREVVTAVKGKVSEWDVINEPFANHDVMDIVGYDAMAKWFRLTHEIDPKPSLVLNDYPPLDGDAVGNPHLDNFYKNLSDVKASGAPLQAIGFQCHIGGDFIPPRRLLSGLERFSKLGLPIVITEFDLDTQDEPAQARYFRDFMIATFSHPSVHGITMWGFWETRHWLPNAALFRKDWSIKPVGKAYFDLVKGDWWTKAKGQSDSQGSYTTRGFLGDYRITVTGKNGKAVTMNASLAKDGKPIVVRFN